jgi:hypothetical protein
MEKLTAAKTARETLASGLSRRRGQKTPRQIPGQRMAAMIGVW